MSDRAALITGASSGIGLAIAHALGEEGYGLTVVARRAEKLENAAEELRSRGHEVHEFAGDLSDEQAIKDAVELHREQFGRLDVLVNSAGIGIGAEVGKTVTSRVDLQLDLNIRAIILFYRECVELLRAAASEHKSALVVNIASIVGKSGEAWLSAYSATKFAVVGFTQSMNKELSAEGIKSVALCPGFVATPMTEWANDQIDPSAMIQPHDLGEAVRFLLRLSPTCLVPEIEFRRPGV